MGNLKILTINFSRFKNIIKILEIWEKFEKYNLDIICIQEIDVHSVLKCFRNKYQVFVNWDLNLNNSIGIATLIKQDQGSIAGPIEKGKI